MKLYLNSKKGQCNAIAKYDNNKIIVLRNSTISKVLSRNTHLSKRVLSYRKDSKIVKDNIVIKDVIFKSSSLAAQFVLGYIVNGKRVWKDENGKALKELESK